VRWKGEKYGECRTKRPVMENYDALAGWFVWVYARLGF
jgi:hypothetical protein